MDRMARLNSIVRERLGILSEPNVKPLATATLFNAAGDNVSTNRLSAGLSAAGSRWSEMLSGSWTDGEVTRRRYPSQRRLSGQPTPRFHVG